MKNLAHQIKLNVMKYRGLVVFLFLLLSSQLSAQKHDSLTIEQIMQDPSWIGTSPSSPFWDKDGSILYFNWNPDKNPGDSLYFITLSNHTPQKVTPREKQSVIGENVLVYNRARTLAVYAHGGDVYFEDLKKKKAYQLTKTADKEFNPQFSFNDSKVVFQRGKNLFAWNIETGEVSQLTNFLTGEKKNKEPKLPRQEEWLKNDQLQYMKVLRERREKLEATENYKEENTDQEKISDIYTGDKTVRNLQISPGGNYITYTLFTAPTASKTTIIPDYVTESGFTTDIPGRQKVGQNLGKSQFFIFSLMQDTIFELPTGSLEGIKDLPDYVADYPEKLIAMSTAPPVREVNFSGSSWSPDGKYLVIDMRSQDNKDRWLTKWNSKDNTLQLLDRQRNEAWIGGPGLWNTGWVNDEEFYFQSEKSGYSHLYIVNVTTGKKRALTSGKYEVQTARLSNDKKSFFITTNEVHPGERQFYKLNIKTGKAQKITTLTGANEVVLSPDESTLAFLYSYSNKPWELYIQKIGKEPVQITHKAQSEEFRSYNWRDPDVITFKANDGAEVYARLYKPENAAPGKPAVIFVHGAGYLQNAHRWWSSYFREYMFHNLLADHGYHVLDIDYRGSAGYGADWRTAIYRHMGGKDLSDQVDGAKYLVENFGVNPQKIGIYGGSYGGFITLMAMFTTPDVFAAGAALRSVTDWANYNHGYTSNILNEPFNDSIAYRKSSPIYYAEGLKGHLLMCHGMIDVNVHFQDIVKLTQRLIELGKDDWELAVYPLEDHAFVEPSSWTDEYKRIFKLFETVLKGKTLGTP